MIILSAKYANAENNSMVISTSDDPSICISTMDNPDIWGMVVDSGVTIEAYVPPDFEPSYPTEVIIASPNGTPYKVMVDDDGTPATEALT